jgi:hypothetical protein
MKSTPSFWRPTALLLATLVLLSTVLAPVQVQGVPSNLALVKIDTRPRFWWSPPLQVDGKYYSPGTGLSLRKGLHVFDAPYWTSLTGWCCRSCGCYIFKYWQDEKGNIVSTSSTFTYNVQSNKNFYAVYEKK